MDMRQSVTVAVENVGQAYLEILRARGIKNQRQNKKIVIKNLLRGHPITVVDSRLEDLVQQGELLPEIAAEIGDELEAEGEPS